MSKEVVEIMVEGGKAKADAQMGQSIAPLGVNIQDILAKINEKTSSFQGMKVPVKITVETDDKSFSVEVGTPPISELIKKELGIEKGAGEPNKDKKANISIEQVIKIAKMKQDSMIINNFKSAVKSVVGSCNSMGILIEGRSAREINNKIDAGSYDEEINSQKTEPSEEKKKILEQQLKDIQEKIKAELEREKAEEEAAKKAAEEAAAKAAEAAPEEEKKEAEEEKKEGEEAEEGAEEAKPGEEKAEEETPKEEKKE